MLASLQSLQYPFWRLITPLGESLILMPAVFVLAAWLLPREQGPYLVKRWLLAVLGAAALTAISKVAFMGWGVGSARFNFTGISGHTMFAAAVYPLLLRTLVSTGPARWHRSAVLLGYLLAILIGVSRVKLGAHSWSEVVSGFWLGAAASGGVLWLARVPVAHPPRWLLGGVAAWLIVMAVGAPPSPAHGWITQVALTLSGRPAPYTRSDLHRPPNPSAAQDGLTPLTLPALRPLSQVGEAGVARSPG